VGERSLGIEVTPSQIKLVEMDSSTVPPKVFGFFSVSLFSSHSENISQQVRAALSHLNPKTKKARMAISNSSFHNLFSLPPIPEKEMREVVKRELRGTLSLPLQEMGFDYRIVGEEERKKIILAVAAPSSSVKKEALFLKDLGLTPELITTPPIALFNALKLMGERDEEIIAHIHLEESKGHILFLRDGRWAFYREFPRSPNIREGILPEVQRSFLYLRQQLRGREVRRIFLSGHGTEGLERDLGEALGMDVEPLLPNLDLSPLKGRAKEFNQILHEFTIPLGLAGKRVKDTVNLLASQASERSYGAILKKVAFAGIALSALTIGLSYAWLSREASNSHRRLQERREAIKRFEPYLTAQRERDLYWKHLALFKDMNYHLLWAETLRELSLLVPPEMVFQSLTLKREVNKIKVTIKGEVFAPKTLLAQEIFNRFYSKIVSSPFFTKVEIDPNTMKVSPPKGDDKDGLVKQEFEVKGELKPLDIEYESP